MNNINDIPAAHEVNVGQVTIGGDGPLVLIAGPCVIESLEMCLRIGEALVPVCESLSVGLIFKASFDKANRSSVGSPRGPGMDEGLAILDGVRSRLGTPVTTDIHDPGQAGPAAQAVDLLQIPAFLCRQTSLLLAAAATGKPVNVKKGQFMSPAEMSNVVTKLEQGFHPGGAAKPANQKAPVILTERGTFFGYNRLVNDFAGLGEMMALGYPVCFDVTHSTQLPGAAGGGSASGGRPEHAAMLARCAAAAGVQALFIETHPDPASSPSDAATMLPLDRAVALLPRLVQIHHAATSAATART